MKWSSLFCIFQLVWAWMLMIKGTEHGWQLLKNTHKTVGPILGIMFDKIWQTNLESLFTTMLYKLFSKGPLLNCSHVKGAKNNLARNSLLTLLSCERGSVIKTKTKVWRPSTTAKWTIHTSWSNKLPQQSVGSRKRRMQSKTGQMRFGRHKQLSASNYDVPFSVKTKKHILNKWTIICRISCRIFFYNIAE